MNEYVLRTNNLSKKYGRQPAVDGVSLTIKKGSIFGFIGQNGSGKSTFSRLVAGLAFPTSGSIELFGKSTETELVQARKRTGAIIEGPALYPHLTAVENLEVQRLVKGIPGKECIEKKLSLVGLNDTGKKKVKNFSLGMKQRLGLAIALLGDPEFLLLDEPINGLDPMGVVEMRELLKQLNREHGVTILISSHILSELHILATHYGFIHRGRLLEQLTAAELNEKCQQYLHIKVNNPEKAVVILEEAFGTKAYDVMPDGVIKLYKFLDKASTVSTVLTREGLAIEQLMPKGEDLELYFTRLVGGVHNG